MINSKSPTTLSINTISNRKILEFHPRKKKSLGCWIYTRVFEWKNMHQNGLSILNSALLLTTFYFFSREFLTLFTKWLFCRFWVSTTTQRPVSLETRPPYLLYQQQSAIRPLNLVLLQEDQQKVPCEDQNVRQDDDRHDWTSFPQY